MRQTLAFLFALVVALCACSDTPPITEAPVLAQARLAAPDDAPLGDAPDGRPPSDVPGDKPGDVKPPTTKPPGSRPTMRLFDFPEFSAPRDVLSIHKDGAFHFKINRETGVLERRDNMGDGQMGVFVVGDQRYYGLVMRMGGNPRPVPGGAFWWKVYDGNPYEGWHQDDLTPGGMPYHVQALPGTAPFATRNIDTHFAFASPLTGIGNPLTGVRTWGHGVKNGWNAPTNGQTFSIQRGTVSGVPTSDPATWTQYPQELLFQPDFDIPWEKPRILASGEAWGGTAESAGVIDPWAGEALLFYTAKITGPADEWGIFRRQRVGRAVAPLAGFDDSPVFVRDPHGVPVFDPALHGGEYGDWGTVELNQMSVTIFPDGGYHLVGVAKEPFEPWASGKKKQGLMNATVAFGHWWSGDRGRTFTADKGNPLFNRAHFGIDTTLGLANQMNSPHTWIDPWANKLYFCNWVNRTGAQNKLGTRLVLMEAPLE